jgi:uncharacterized protein YdiU (UPF0061 family)
MIPDIPFDNSFARLPGSFYARVAPTPVSAPQLVKLNIDLALQLGLDPCSLASPEGVEVLAGSRLASGAEPTFRRLCDAAASQEADAAVRILFEDGASYDDWAARWRIRLAQEAKDGAACRAQCWAKTQP